jgi:hypothetical protein
MNARDTPSSLVAELTDLHGEALKARQSKVMDLVWEALDNLYDDLRFASGLPYRPLDMDNVPTIHGLLEDLPAAEWGADFDADVMRMVEARDAARSLLGLPAGGAA